MTNDRPRPTRGRTLLAPLALLALLAVPLVMAQDGSDAAPAPDAPAREAPAEAPADASEDAAERRVITIDSSGGTQSGNLRYGPIHYEHPDPRGITATVSDLVILAPRASLQAPPDTLLSQAKGSRTATFEGDVAVERGRLDATGPGLVYEEATGLGLLSGGVDIEIEPQDPADDTTRVTAESAEFDVDTDRSVSRGDVVLVDGPQRAEADELTFAEDRDLGRLVCEGLCTIVREDSESGTLTITAAEIRVLTGEERLWARGDVTVVDDDITSTGEEAFYDDTEGVAEILGSPARSVDEANGVELESDRIQQFVDLDYVEAIDASLPRDAALDPFLFEEEADGPAATGDPAGDASGEAAEDSAGAANDAADADAESEPAGEDGAPEAP